MTLSNTPMQYVRLGNSGLRVSRMCLGCMSFGDPEWSGWAKTEEESLPLIKKACDLGINFFDTADVYSNGESEVVLGNAIRKLNLPRDRIVVATKVFFPTASWLRFPGPMKPERDCDPTLVNTYGLSRKHIFDAVDASLKRLGLDYIDLYQIHRFDVSTPVEETMEALHDLVKMGKIRYIGASLMRAWEFQKMNSVAEKNGWTKFISMQNVINLLYREEEREMIPYCVDQGIGLIPFAPLANGLLSGKNRSSDRSKTPSPMKMAMGGQYTEADVATLDRVAELADKRNVSLSRVAAGWLLSKSYNAVPIFGATKEEHLVDIVAALDLNLTEEEVKYLEEPYVPKRTLPNVN